MFIIQKKFKTTVPGKWILAGEHAVIRGGPAILFPLPAFNLILEYQPNNTPWYIQQAGNLTHSHQSMLYNVVEHAFHLIEKKPPTQGTLFIENHIPFSAGLGASAALCTAISKWFIFENWIAHEKLIEFARQLENLFHGESSGADIAVTATQQSIYFIRNQLIQPFITDWQPNWYLSHCGEQSTTSDCLNIVDTLWKKDPTQAAHIDDIMKNSVTLAKTALNSTHYDHATSPASNLALLKKSIDNAAAAFSQWGLISSTLKQHMDELTAAGALAVKPTGSGYGGFVLSLWPNEFIPQSTVTTLIKLNTININAIA